MKPQKIKHKIVVTVNKIQLWFTLEYIFDFSGGGRGGPLFELFKEPGWLNHSHFFFLIIASKTTHVSIASLWGSERYNWENIPWFEPRLEGNQCIWDELESVEMVKLSDDRGMKLRRTRGFVTF